MTSCFILPELGKFSLSLRFSSSCLLTSLAHLPGAYPMKQGNRWDNYVYLYDKVRATSVQGAFAAADELRSPNSSIIRKPSKLLID